MLDIFLLVSRENNHTTQAIDSFIKIKTDTPIKKYISINEKLLDKLDFNKKDLKNTFVIVQKKTFNIAREHVKNLLKRSRSKYVMYMHDDDIFSEDIAINIFKILKRFEPIALASRATYINNESKIFLERQSVSCNKIKKMTIYGVLNRYFFPFDRSVLFPTVVFNREKYLSYWSIHKKSIGKHEDVRIISYFAEQGLFLEDQNTSNYFLRLHPYQDSNLRDARPRMKLISWLRSLNINFIYKFVLICSAKIQYYIYYKKFDSLLIKKFRDALIKKRQGGKAYKKLLR